MSTQRAKSSPVRVEVAGTHYEGRYSVDSGVLTVWYQDCAKSVALRDPEPELQARLVLTQIAVVNRRKRSRTARVGAGEA